MDEPLQFRKIGFIGLGAMGKPMVVHLATKLPVDSQIFVFDIDEVAMHEVCTQFPGKVFRALSARDVAQQAVGSISMSRVI